MEASHQRPLDGADLGATPALTPDAVAGFRASLNGTLVLPQDPDFDAAREVHNARFDRRPTIVVRAADASDVSRAVTFAAEHDLELAIRSGGHSLSGHGTSDG